MLHATTLLLLSFCVRRKKVLLSSIQMKLMLTTTLLPYTQSVGVGRTIEVPAWWEERWDVLNLILIGTGNFKFKSNQRL
jgi:hypothetical protein